MKGIKSLLLSLLSIVLLTSCGGHMDDWPYCDLPDDVANYSSVTIKIIEKDYKNDNNIIRNDTYYSDSNEMVLNFYNLIENMHVSPKTTNNKIYEYLSKVSIIFEKDDVNYTFQFYELAMTDGYFVYNFNEIYKFKGNLYGVVSNEIDRNTEKLVKI